MSNPLLAKLAALKAQAASTPAQSAATSVSTPELSSPEQVPTATAPSLPSLNRIATAVAVNAAKPAPDLMDNLLAAAKPASILSSKEVAHQEVRNELINMQDWMSKHHPLLPNSIAKVRRILKANDDLVPELTPEEIGIISAAILEASQIKIIEKATKSRGKTKNLTEDDLL